MAGRREAVSALIGHRFDSAVAVFSQSYTLVAVMVAVMARARGLMSSPAAGGRVAVERGLAYCRASNRLSEVVALAAGRRDAVL